MFVRWLEKYAIGMEKIDAQHKRLLELIDEVYIFFLDVEKRANADEFEIVKTIQDFCIEHIRDEEELMIKHNYPRYIEHKSKHETIKEIANHFRTQMKTNSIIDYEAFFHFLNDWIFEHFETEDMALVSFLKSSELNYEEDL